jgi:hypothetical protein
MPSNSTGWFWHSLARETGKLGHLYSPGGQRGPWPWFPYACDNGAFSCWDPKTNTFDDDKWKQTEPEWLKLIHWTWRTGTMPLWCIIPDVPGNAERTLERWHTYSKRFLGGIPLAMAVQDGMEPSDVLALEVRPEVIAVGGSTEFKWATLEKWTEAFDRVHVLRCNSPAKLYVMEELGVESCDGTGWLRGDKVQTSGLERWARETAWQPYKEELWPFVCSEAPRKQTRRRNTP